MKQRTKRMIVAFALFLGLRGLTPAFAQEFKQYRAPVEHALQQKKPPVFQYKIKGSTVKIEFDRLIIEDIRKNISFWDKGRLISYFAAYEKEYEKIDTQRDKEFNNIKKRKKEIDELQLRFYEETNRRGFSKEQERLITSKQNELRKDEKKSSDWYWVAHNKNQKTLYERIYNLLASKLFEIAKLHNNEALMLLIDWCSKYSEKRFYTLKSLGESILRILG